MERVFPDANVLYPISLADLTLRLGDIAIHALLWSEDLLSEVERVLVEYKRLTPDQASYFCSCIRETFPEGQVERAAYDDLIDGQTGPDPKDHVHSAAAIGGGATILITADASGFPAADLGKVRKLTPDEYFCEVPAEFPNEVLVVLEAMGPTVAFRRCWATPWVPYDERVSSPLPRTRRPSPLRAGLVDEVSRDG